MLRDDQRDELGRWVQAVAPRAQAFARSLVPDPTQADDVVQECLYRLLRRADQYDLLRDGVKLLFKSISNLCINQATRKKTLLSLDSPTADAEAIDVPDAVGWRPDQMAEHHELEDRIRAALQTLAPLQRAAVELRALGMSKEEIAGVLDVSANYAGVLIHRGRQALSQLLGVPAP